MVLTCDIHRSGHDQSPSVCFHILAHHDFPTDILDKDILKPE